MCCVMAITLPSVYAPNKKRWDEGIGYQEREVFEAFLKLPVAQRKVVREVILAFVKADAAE